MTSRTRLALIASAASIVVLVLVVVFVIRPLVAKSSSEAGAAKVTARYTKSDVVMQDLQANSLGRESGESVRGDGALVLTRKVLHFFLAAPARELEIPLDRIEAVDLVRTHQGKTRDRDLLQVSFTDASGKRDTIAWLVQPDAATWRAKLRELTGK